MHILITRPQQDAAELATILAARGIESTVEPLLAIRPVQAPEISLDNVQAILFTSANGVRCFAAASDRRDIKVFTVGDNAAEEARVLGFQSVESATGDVDALAKLVGDRLHPRDGHLLHAAGGTLAGDLRGQLQATGFVVNRIVLYDAEPVTELSPATVMNLRLGGIDAVALFSPRTARLFASLWRQAQNGDEAGLGAVTAFCLSAAAAAEIDNLGWRRVAIAETPDRKGMLAVIEQEKNRGDSAMAHADDESTPAPTETVEKTEATGKTESMASSAAADAARGAAIIAAAPAPRSGRAGALFLGLVAGAVAGGIVTVTAPYWRPYLPLPQAAIGGDAGLGAEIAAIKEQLATLQAGQDVDAEARSRIDALQAEIAKWKQELESATGQVSGAPSAAADLAPLEGRLEALEGRLASLSAALEAQTANDGTNAGAIAPESDAPATGDSPAVDSPAADSPVVDSAVVDNLTDRLTGLEAKLAALDALTAETATQKAEIETAKARLANLDTLDSRLKSLEETATTMSGELQTIAQDQGERSLQQQRAAARVLSIGQLRSALSGNQPFGAELSALEDLTRPDAEIAARLTPILDPLRASAAIGVPTLSQLQASFPATAIAQAATADAAGDAIGVEADWLQKTLNRLSELITVRPVGDVAGDGALAALARAESRLATGDLAAATAELNGLSNQSAAAAAAWRAEAEARLALEAAAAQLSVLSAETLVPAANAAQSN